MDNTNKRSCKKVDCVFCFHALVVCLFLLAAFFPWRYFFSSRLDLQAILLPPSFEHLIGTDNLGRDLLVRVSQVISGAIFPLWITALGATFVGIAGGVLTLAAERKNKFLKIGSGYLRLCLATIASVPVGIAVFGFAVIQERAGITPVVLAIGFLVFIRSLLQIHELHAQDRGLAYWQAHEALGGSPITRIFRYGIVGRWRDSLVSSLFFHLQVAVTIEASLSYLGFGIQEPQASFGNMLASHLDLYLKGHWGILGYIVGGILLCSQFPSSVWGVVQKLSRVRRV